MSFPSRVTRRPTPRTGDTPPDNHGEDIANPTVPAGRLYGLLAEFASADQLAASTRRARQDGYQQIDAFSPFPVDDVADALDFRWTEIPTIVLIGGIVGGLTGYALQYWVSVIAYPINVGGRPLNSIPSFVPVTFEMTILFAALAGAIGMLALNGLPRPYHPVFNAPSFARATRDGFFLLIEASDPRFDREETRRYLLRLHATEVQDVSL
jgi:hypothetical protein